MSESNNSIENFKSLIEKYKQNDSQLISNSKQLPQRETRSSTQNKTAFKPKPNNKGKSNKKTSNAKLSLTNLTPVPDLLKEDMLILFIGVNPGVQSSQRQRHFGNPRNLFWPLLFQSGLVSTELSCTDDEYLLTEYNYGFTNLAGRPTPGMDDLSTHELKEGVPVLKEKIIKYRPKVCCFLGIQIYRYFIQDLRKSITVGFQQDSIEELEDTRFFVTASTSGRVSQYSREDRLNCLKELAQWANENHE